MADIEFTPQRAAAASETVAGKVELATIAEVNTGTDAVRAVTPDALAGSNLGEKAASIVVYVSDARDSPPVGVDLSIVSLAVFDLLSF